MKFKDLINERVMVSDFDDYIRVVANAFDAAPRIMPEAKPYYDALYHESQNWMVRIASHLNMDIKNVEQYNSFDDMVHDVKNNHHLSVSAEYRNHPYWTDYEYRTVRITHDYLAHSIVGNPFGPKGEVYAYNTHCKLFSPKARPALFTEIVGTNCWYGCYGHVPEEKCAILPGFDYNNIGRMIGPTQGSHKHFTNTMKRS